MLEGFDNDWKTMHSAPSATYTNLPHGQFTFRVQAANNDNVWNENELAVSLVKHPAIWETTWFRFGLLLTLLVLTGLGIRLYTQKVRQRNKELNQEIEDRKKIEKALQLRDQYMDKLVQERTQQLEIKNTEVSTLLSQIQNRNDELEDLVAQRTAELEAYNKELKRSNYDLEQFAYIASHDLQAPLRTINSFSELLEKSLKEKLSTTEKEFLGFITSSVSNMRELVNSLLTFSRVNVKRGDIVPIKMENLLYQIQTELNSAIKEKEAIIHVNNLPPLISGDKIKIKQLFQNLLSNAIKFSRTGIAPVIQINAIDKTDYWMFEIIDNGIGIDKEFHQKIFQIFQRLHTSEQFEGTGIGLALCKKIVEQHRGTIEIINQEGEGSRFIFTIKKNLAITAEVSKRESLNC